MTRVLSGLLALVLGCGLVVWPVSAQGGDTHTLSVDGFSMAYPAALGHAVHIVHPDPTDQMVGGSVPVQPPHVEIKVLSPDMMVEVREDMIVGPTIYIYDIAAAQASPDYAFSMEEIAALQTLLATRPAIAGMLEPAESVGSRDALPYLPLTNAHQSIRVRARYVESETVKGVVYLTAFTQNIPTFQPERFQYTFQGLSTDGQVYIAAWFPVVATTFPADLTGDFDYGESFELVEPHRQAVWQWLTDADSTAFQPSLVDVDAMIASFVWSP